jgi:hypothetical protein
MTGKSDSRKKFDFYETPSNAVYALLKREKFNKDGSFLDWCTGRGRIAKAIKKFFGEDVDLFSSDLHNYGYGDEIGIDFAKNYHEIHKKEDWFTDQSFDYCIVNPPYDQKTFIKFINNSKKVTRKKVCLLLKLNHLPGVDRYKNYVFLDKEFPLSKVYIFVQRLNFGVRDKKTNKRSSSTLEYCWCILDRGYKGSPTIEWIYFNKKKKKSEEK